MFGDLFAQVQERRLFADSKTFVDAEPLMPAEDILAAWQPGLDDGQLREFVIAHFALPAPVLTDAIPRQATLAEHIAALWPFLTRPAVPDDTASLLAFPHDHVVPGGRFRELYYWDSYFTMLGLALDGREDLVAAMIDGFAGLIERHEHIPNGTRSYYLGRSQPPVFYLMPAIVGHQDNARWRGALQREYAFWMSGGRCVTMPDGALLNRYWDESSGPRDESWIEDMETGTDLGRELRAAAESGWDFSSRWLDDASTLSTIRTTRYIPCDLNALLYGMEEELQLHEAAERRREAMTRWLWDAAEGRFGDWDLDDGRINPGLTAATLVPLFSGAATVGQADAIARTTEELLLAPHGLRTTLVQTGQQWDAPNGWAPLHWFAIIGLRRYGHAALAETIARRWLGLVEQGWKTTGLLFEKYDVESGAGGEGGEYEPQYGFGWTNGVTRALIDLYG